MVHLYDLFLFDGIYALLKLPYLELFVPDPQAVLLQFHFVLLNFLIFLVVRSRL